MGENKRMHPFRKLWLTLDEAAKELGTETEGLRQALESGELAELPIMVYSGAGRFPAEMCVDADEPVPCLQGDADGWFQPQDLYNDDDEWQWLSGYFRLHPSSISNVAMNRTLYQADVSPRSWWSPASEIPRNEIGEVGLSFCLRTKDSKLTRHPGIVENLDPIFSLDNLRFSAADIAALKDRSSTTTATFPGELTVRESRAVSEKWPWGSHETEALGHLEAAAKQWWSLYDPTDATTAHTNDEVADWLMKERGVSSRMAYSIASLLRADGLPSGRRK